MEKMFNYKIVRYSLLYNFHVIQHKKVGKIFGAEAQDGTFLSANVLLWSVTTFIVGMFFCTAIGKIALIDCIANVMCVAVYAGVIGGVIGGFLFLIHRHNGKQL